jgi:hypothetical protein
MILPLELPKIIFSVDCETNGLWGIPFSISVIVINEKKEILERYFSRLPDSFVTHEYVLKNVLPSLSKSPVTHADYYDFLGDFFQIWKKWSSRSVALCHMGYICEAFLWREGYNLGMIEWNEAPYPLLDVASQLELIGEKSDSVDNYFLKHGLKMSEIGAELSVHHPEFDAERAALVYFDIKEKFSI